MARRQNPGTLVDGLTQKQKAFIEAFAVTGTIIGAARASGTTPSLHYQALRSPNAELYRFHFERAKEQAADYLESEAVRRAVDGDVIKKFTGKGDPIIDPETGKQYTERKRSDALLMFLLKAMKPERYGDKQAIDLTSKGESLLPSREDIVAAKTEKLQEALELLRGPNEPTETTGDDDGSAEGC